MMSIGVSELAVLAALQISLDQVPVINHMPRRRIPQGAE